MDKMKFNQESVNRKIAEIKALDEKNRKEISDKIKKDIRAWLLSNFEFTQEEQNCMKQWPQSMREETGFGIGTALLYSEWNLKVNIPNDPPPIGARRKSHSQSVSGSYNTQTGGYTVTKTHTISW